MNDSSATIMCARTGPGSRRSRWWRAVTGLVMVVILVAAVAGPAAATLSIIAVDPETGEVGAAIMACSPVSALGEPDEVPAPLVLVPGRGAAVAQGSIDPADLAQLRAAVADPTIVNADEAIARATQDNDPDLQTGRQYSVVLGGAAPSVAVVGGDEVTPAAVIARGDNVAVQGTALASEGAVGEAMAAYLSTKGVGASLDDALVQALVAASDAGGDAECGEQRALFAHVSVAEPGDDGLQPGLLLTVTVDEGDGQNPVSLLADAHRDRRTGWVDAGLRPPATVSRLLVGAFAVLLALASILAIRYGLGYRFRPRR